MGRRVREPHPLSGRDRAPHARGGGHATSSSSIACRCSTSSKAAAPGTRWCALAKAVEAAGATIINTGIGWHEARIPTIATMVPRAAFAWVTRRLQGRRWASRSSRPTASTIPATGEAVLARGDADMVSMARPFLADPGVRAQGGRRIAPTRSTPASAATRRASTRSSRARSRRASSIRTRATRRCSIAPPRAQKKRSRSSARVPPASRPRRRLRSAATTSRCSMPRTRSAASSTSRGAFPARKSSPRRCATSARASRELGVERRARGAARGRRPRGLRRRDRSRPASCRACPRFPASTIRRSRATSTSSKGARRRGARVAIVGAGGIGFDVAEFLTAGTRPTGTRATATSTIPRSRRFATSGASTPPTRARGGLRPPHEHAAAAQGVAPAAQGSEGRRGSRQDHRLDPPRAAQAPRRGDDRRRRVRADRRRRACTSRVDGEPQVLAVDTIVICAGQEPRRELVAGLVAAGIPHRAHRRRRRGARARCAAARSRRARRGAALAVRLAARSLINGETTRCANVCGDLTATMRTFSRRQFLGARLPSALAALSGGACTPPIRPSPARAAAQRDRAGGRAEAPAWKATRATPPTTRPSATSPRTRAQRAQAQYPDRRDPRLRRFARGARPRVRPESGRPLRRARRGQHRDARTCSPRSSTACSSSARRSSWCSGHSSCGAVDAAIKVVKSKAQLPGHLPELITAIKPAVDRGSEDGAERRARTTRSPRTCGARSRGSRRSPPIVQKAYRDKKIDIAGGVYDIATGKVTLV